MATSFVWLAACLAPGSSAPQDTVPAHSGLAGDPAHSAGSAVETGTCPNAAMRFDSSVCVETTAVGYDQGPSYTSDTLLDFPVTGTVTYVGPYAHTPGTTVVSGFEGCSHVAPTDMVQLVDGDGRTWSLAWHVDHEPAPLPAAVATPGEPVTLEVRTLYTYYYRSGALLRGADGLRFVYDGDIGFGAERLDGLAHEHGAQVCEAMFDPVWHELYDEVFDGVSVWSGSSAIVDLGGAPFRVAVPFSGWALGCDDVCGARTWMGWR